MNRREFLKGTAWMGAAAFAAGCQLNRLGFGEGGQMQEIEGLILVIRSE